MLTIRSTRSQERKERKLSVAMQCCAEERSHRRFVMSLLPGAALCCLQMYFLTTNITNFMTRKFKTTSVVLWLQQQHTSCLRVTDDDLLVWFPALSNMLMHCSETTQRSIQIFYVYVTRRLTRVPETKKHLPWFIRCIVIRYYLSIIHKQFNPVSNLLPGNNYRKKCHQTKTLL